MLHAPEAFGHLQYRNKEATSCDAAPILSSRGAARHSIQ
jgi:hypothetical protein